MTLKSEQHKDKPAQRRGWLQFYLLGGCRIRTQEGEVRLESAKTRALLLYLALNPGQHRREHLMGLLWGGFPEANARRNLRHALWNIKRNLVCPGGAPVILAAPDSLAFNPACDRWLDVEVFQTLADSASQANPTQALRKAAEYYRGDFLQGFYLRAAPEFEEWALVERERLHTLAQQVLRELTVVLTAEGKFDPAQGYARRLLALEPWWEEAHRLTMDVLDKNGQRSAALQQYETCRQVLAAELGVEPSRETRALYQQIAAGERSGHKPNQISSPDPYNLPAPTTLFIGRIREQREIAELLAEPGCRLLTVLGPGGVGKTRLALQAARNAREAYPGGVCFVPLAALDVPERIPAAIADNLQVVVPAHLDPKQAVEKFLKPRRALLVLDNFEHLTAGVEFLIALLSAAPGLQLLVTSRQRLNLQAEWIYDLAGLSIPEIGGSSADFDGDRVSKSEAVQLFLQGARRVARTRQFDGEGIRDIAQICQLVEGNPLAIELAAAQSRASSIQQIAAQIRQNLDSLETSQRDLPARQRSLRAAFQYSWGLLKETERQAILRVGVFQGGFNRKAAQEIGGLSRLTLSRLVNHSLLRGAGAGRYHVHEVVRIYLVEHLRGQPEEWEAVQAAHTTYYLQFLAAREPEFLGSGQAEALRLVGAEIANLRAAWEWALAKKRADLIGPALEGLYLFYDLRGWFEEGEERFGRGVAAFEPLVAEQKLVGRLQARRAVFCKRRGDYACAAAYLEAARDRFLVDGPQAELAFTWNQLGNVADLRGDYPSARTSYAHSLSEWEAVGDERGVAIALNNLGLAAQRMGEFDEAIRLYRRSLKQKRALGYLWGQAITLDNLANTYRIRGAFEEARSYFVEALGLAQSIQAQTLCLEILVGLAELQLVCDENNPAKRLLLAVVRHPVVTQETQTRARRALTEIGSPEGDSRPVEEEIEMLIENYIGPR